MTLTPTDDTALPSALTDPTLVDEPWVDTKRRQWAWGLVVPAIPLISVALWAATGGEAWLVTMPILMYIVLPLVDARVGEDTANPPESAVAQLEADRYYRVITYLYAPIQYASYALGAWVFVSGDLSWFGRIALAISVGAVGGIGIANAHELGHKKERIERRFAKVVLAQTGYGHFYVEHNRGHHARVATPEDPASSRLGESFWEFLPRTVVGALRSAWTLEANRLKGRNQRVWSVRNHVLNAWLMSVVLFGATIAWLGVDVIAFIVIQAVFGFSLLEVVNYVEHYGLLRRKLATGRYERCRPEHSWNSNHIASNLVLYHLERHSDHHANPTRRYQALRHFDESPQLPNGYGLMIGLAYLPPVWRRVMDKRVVAHYDGDVTRANIHPRRRERILSTWNAQG